MSKNSPKPIVVGGEQLSAILEEHLSSATLAAEPQALPEGTNLIGANLDGAFLKAARLRGLLLDGATLRNADLEDADLLGIQAKSADFLQARLTKACLRSALLQGSVFDRADLRGADLNGADLRGASLIDADLRDGEDSATKTETLGIRLGGANLKGAQVSSGLNFSDALAVFQDAADAAFNLLLFFAAGLLYSLLMVLSSTDDKLIPAYGTLPLPFLQTTVPISDFFTYTPMILLLPYGYVLFHLLRYFRLASDLPAVFPDGKPIDEQVRPWVLSVLLRRVSLARSEASDTDWWGTRWFADPCTDFLVWFGTPAVISLFWYRYLVFHDWGTNIFIELLGLAGLALGTAFEARAKQIVSAAHSPVKKRAVMWWSTQRTVLLAVIAAVSTTISIASAFHGLDRVFYANFESRDVTTRPDKWDEEKPTEIKGAALANKSLRYVDARHAFLVHADFHESHLENAFFEDADLRGANFQAATLIGASFDRARLAKVTFLGHVLFVGPGTTCDEKSEDSAKTPMFKKANLTGAVFEQAAALCGVSFTEATLDGTVFGSAYLQNAEFDLAKAEMSVNFRGAHLSFATFKDSTLPYADFTGAGLDGANMSGAKLTYADFTDATMKDKGGCPDFSGADLSVAILTETQISSMQIDKQTKLPIADPAKPVCPRGK